MFDISTLWCELALDAILDRLEPPNAPVLFNNLRGVLSNMG